MAKRIWVDGRRARTGALVALVGLVLLVATQGLRAGAVDPNCASMVNPERARECVAESAQTLDRESLYSMLAIALAATFVAAGGVLVLRARRRVLDIAEAAKLAETDVPGIRSLIAGGALASFTSNGRTYVDAMGVERLIGASFAAGGSATPGRA